MAGEARFETGMDYDVPLLRLLAELPGGEGQAGDVVRLFREQYEDRIPQEHYGARRNGNPIWVNLAHWARNHLKDCGFLDASRYGIWAITEDGRRWLEDNPTAVRIDGRPRSRTRNSHKKTPPQVPQIPGVTLTMLEQTRKLMPTDQFSQVWGEIYDRLLAEERAKSTTTITQTELGRHARGWLDQVNAFLTGKSANIPSSEVVCDWIQFCYILELHREAAALLPFVNEDQVDSSMYRRAKRIAEVSRGRIAG